MGPKSHTSGSRHGLTDTGYTEGLPCILPHSQEPREIQPSYSPQHQTPSTSLLSMDWGKAILHAGHVERQGNLRVSKNMVSRNDTMLSQSRTLPDSASSVDNQHSPDTKHRSLYPYVLPPAFLATQASVQSPSRLCSQCVP